MKSRTSYSRYMASLAAVGLLAGVVSATPGHASETIKLTAIDGYPDVAIWVERFRNYYVPELDKELAKTGNYTIDWNLALNGQIARAGQIMPALQQGLGDFAIVTHIFHTDKVPIYGISFNTPFVSTDPLLVTRVIDDLVDEFPAFKESWKPYNQVTLTNGITLDTYQLFMRDRVDSIEGLRDKKILAGGDNRKYLAGWGATPVGGPLPGYYDSLKTGIADGAMVWAQAAGALKFAEVTPYMIDLRIGAMASKAINLNTRTWDNLPEEVRAAMQKVAIGYRDQMAFESKSKGEALLKKYLAEGGEVVEVTDEERRQWAMALGPIATEWAEAVEAQGLPGRAVLRAYMDAMRAANQPIVRHWDRELTQ